MRKKPSPASDRFAEFRSWAREISDDAKRNKKFGKSNDLNGQMARAMERAYKQGFEDAQTGRPGITVSKNTDPDNPEPVPATQISSKIDGALFSIGLKQMGTERRFNPDPSIRSYYLQEDYISDFRRKAPDWQLVPSFSQTPEKGVSDRTIQQLVKLGILENPNLSDPALLGKNILVLSAKGRATYFSMFIEPRLEPNSGNDPGSVVPGAQLSGSTNPVSRNVVADYDEIDGWTFTEEREEWKFDDEL